MCFCMRIPNRVHCIFGGIGIIIICSVSMSLIFWNGTYDTSHSIFLAGLVLSIIAAFCLIFAAALNMVIPVWVWLVIILPSTLLVVIGHCLILRGYWDYETDLTKATDVIFLIVYICMVVVTVYNSLLFLGSLNKEDT